jgi:hypothetical protein
MRHSKRLLGIGLLLAVLGPAVYLAVCWRAGLLGFPLDDAWIHQTYARNLVATGTWSFEPGVPSAGSTSPLWTLLIAFGRWIGAGPIPWTFALGIFFFGLTGLLAYRWAEAFDPRVGVLAAALSLTEWHLIWAAVSGMEIPLLTFWLLSGFLLSTRLAAVERVSSHGSQLALLGFRGLLGLFFGLGIWIRPEAVVAVPFMILSAEIHELPKPRGLVAVAYLSLLAALPILGYFRFNMALSGHLWPNTFYAKQEEYNSLLVGGFLSRIVPEAAALLAGPLAVLWPGVLLAVAFLWRARRWELLFPLGWAAAHLLLYTLRLPATYQHGRYLMPVLPVLVCYSAFGLLRIWRNTALGRWGWIVSRAWLGSVAAVTLSFFVLGAQAYVQDVGVIETEMVRASKWVAANTPPGAVVAAHDIGALGYVGGRKLVDLGGLTQPNLPLVFGTTQALSSYLDRQGTDYLVTFPGLYPSLTQSCVPLWTTQGTYSPRQGGENMAVFRWHHGCS